MQKNAGKPNTDCLLCALACLCPYMQYTMQQKAAKPLPSPRTAALPSGASSPSPQYGYATPVTPRKQPQQQNPYAYGQQYPAQVRASYVHEERGLRVRVWVRGMQVFCLTNVRSASPQGSSSSSPSTVITCSLFSDALRMKKHSWVKRRSLRLERVLN
eukprot:269393-Pelagomonas_calceolata.AAC.3